MDDPRQGGASEGNYTQVNIMFPSNEVELPSADKFNAFPPDAQKAILVAFRGEQQERHAWLRQQQANDHEMNRRSQIIPIRFHDCRNDRCRGDHSHPSCWGNLAVEGRCIDFRCGDDFDGDRRCGGDRHLWPQRAETGIPEEFTRACKADGRVAPESAPARPSCGTPLPVRQPRAPAPISPRAWQIFRSLFSAPGLRRACR